MKLAKYLLPLILSSSLLTGVVLAQSDPENNPANVTTPQTEVEIRNEVPANPPQAPAPNLDIDMPAAPDVNVTIPGGDTTRETVTERSQTTIIDDTDDRDAASNTNFIYLVLFGVLALFLIGMVVMAASRRTTVVDDI